MRVLVTGAAGFIGSNTAQRLLGEGHSVIGVDDLNDYYDPQLKKDRLALLESHPQFSFHLAQVQDRQKIQSIFEKENIEVVIHLAAQAGVRYSLENPYAYIDSNINGFITILEGCRHHNIQHLVYASSSSVYGLNTNMPFSENKGVDHPVSLYAATKKSNELMAHSYSHLYNLPTTGLRFFTVYGPWGRPDMALFSFTRAIIEGKTIQIYNHGKMKRDFTYIDDIVEGVTRILKKVPSVDENWNSREPNPAKSSAPFAVYNIGNHTPVELGTFIAVLEAKLGIEAIKEYLPLQPGDVPVTSADIQNLFEAVGFSPDTPIEKGIGAFVDWYRNYHAV